MRDREPYVKPTVIPYTFIISQRFHDEVGDLLKEGFTPERIRHNLEASLARWDVARKKG